MWQERRRRGAGGGGGEGSELGGGGGELTHSLTHYHSPVQLIQEQQLYDRPRIVDETLTTTLAKCGQ